MIRLKHLAYTALVVDAMILATFFYPPTLEIYMGWIDHMLGVVR